MMTLFNRMTNKPLLASLVALRHLSLMVFTFLMLGFSFNTYAATTTTLTTSATTAVVGVNVTLTASVAGVSPTGNVVFKDGTTTIGTVATTGTAATRTAVLTTNFTTVGSHSITAVYAGDVDDATSTSAAKAITATIKTTTNTLTVSPTTAAVNTSVALTATLVGYTPTGTVTFKDGTTTIGTATLTGTGTTATATLNTTFSVAGSHSLTAVYAGDANDATKTSTAKAFTVSKGVTTTTLTTSVATTVVGQAITLTTTVTGFNPTGTVTFKDGTATLGTGTLSGTGNSRTATFNAILTTVASHSLTVVYAGDTNNATSTSAASVVTATIASTTTVLSAPATAQLNQSITLTATVTGYTPTGTVTFKEGATVLGTATLAGTGTTTKTATLNKAFTVLGVHNITAVTTGDANDATSTSAVYAVTVNPVTTTTTVTANPTTANLAQNVTLTASVVGLSPAGNITFKDGTTVLGTVATTGTGTTRTANLSTSFNAAGIHSITASYAGDTDDAPSISVVNNLTITTSTSTTLSASPSTLVINANVTLTANITGVSPTGTVTFKEGTTTLGTGTLTSTGATTASATLTTSFSGIGTHVLTAVYGGDAINLTSTAAAININITAVPTVSITAPLNNISYIGPVDVLLVANVTDNINITQVNFYDGATLLGTATQQGVTSNYTFNWINVAQGSHVISAVGTITNGNTTTSAPIQMTVTVANPTAAQIYYIHTDQLDTPRLITNSSNVPVWKWDNTDPFGNNPVNDDPNSTGTHFTFNQRLPGQYYDSETNTHYNYFRDYDPQTGRYIESDPIGLAGGVNTYLYAYADPLSFIDPEGLTGNSAQRRGARRAQPPGPVQPSTNAPGNTEDTLGVGARGAGCAFAFLSEAASQACMPMVCVEWSCKPSCGDPYRIYKGQHSFTSPDTKCECVRKEHDINTPVENGL